MATWRRTISVHPHFRDPALTFPARRDAIVAVLRDSGWPATNLDVDEFVDELAHTRDEAEFDEVWNALYDQADTDRIWLDTSGPAR